MSARTRITMRMIQRMLTAHPSLSVVGGATAERPFGLRQDEVQQRAGPCQDAVDGERREPVRLEEAHQEAHRQVRRHRRAERADERLPAHAAPLVAEELRQLEHRGGAEDRGREEEREPRRVLVREADDEAAAQRRGRAREARDERDRLRRADEEGAAPADLARDPRVVVARGLRRPATQELRAVEQEAVQDQEEGGRARGGEDMPELVLEQEAEDPGRDRPDDEQPAQLRVHVVGSDLALAEAAAEAAHDPHPVAPEEAEQDDRRREVGRDEEGEEVRVVLVDVPAQEARQDDAVAEARDGEELGHALEQTEDHGLPVRDQARERDRVSSARAPSASRRWRTTP